MKDVTPQADFWSGTFGDEYTKREHYAPEEFDAVWKKYCGTTRSELNEFFFSSFDKDIKVLEVAANYGLQLQLLQKMGFTNLYGLEINRSAIELARKEQHDIYIIQGDALDLPFKDSSFDLVYTSAFLIHVAPENRKRVMSEVVRVSKRYIWGYEFFSAEQEEIHYRGNTNVAWKTNFSKLYEDMGLHLIKDKKFDTEQGNVDSMFLLEK